LEGTVVAVKADFEEGEAMVREGTAEEVIEATGVAEALL